MFSEAKLAANNKFLRDSLNPVSGINVNFANYNNNTIELNISNLQILPVKILGIQFDKDKNFFLEDEIFIEEKKHNKPFTNNIIRINCENYSCEKNEIEKYKIIYKILGQTKNKFAKIEFWNNSTEIKNLRKHEENYERLKKIPFFQFKNNQIILKKGNWNIENKIIIPENYEFIVQPETELTFKNEGQIISFSPIFIIGKKDEPIIIKSNFTGDLNEYREGIINQDFGFGILVIKAKKKSIISHVVFDKLSSPSITSKQSASGSINFYESDVEITNSKFLNNLRGDDYLNIIRSNFLLSNLNFENTNGDSIDIDFSNGIIKDSVFNKSFNDAIDFSGSEVNLFNIKIIDAGDKAISAGEESKISIKNMSISNSKMGLASKDKSELFAEDVNIFETDIAISAYIKKSEYGPAFVEGKNIVVNDAELKYFKQKNSIMTINDEVISEINCNKYRKICNSLEY